MLRLLIAVALLISPSSTDCLNALKSADPVPSGGRETPDSPQPAEVSGQASCFLVVNCDMTSGRTCFDIIPAPESPYQIVYDVQIRDDTIFYVNLFLPYTWPKRDFRAPHFMPYSDVFRIHLIDGTDTAQYRVICPRDSSLIKVEPISERNFVRPLRVNYLPKDLLVIQIEGHDLDLAGRVRERFVDVARDTILATGFYHGIPCQIRAVKRGAQWFNETADGRILALKLVSTYQTETLSNIKTDMIPYRLKWYQVPSGGRD